MRRLVDSAAKLFGVFPRRGYVVAEKYRLEKRIDKGSTGDVWVALDQSNGAKIAIKFALKRGENIFFTPQSLNEIMSSEAVFCEELSSVGTVPGFIKTSSVEGRNYIAMKLLQGIRMYDYFEKGGSFSLEEALFLGYQMIDGLSQIHENGKFHADFSPGNLMYHRRKGTIKIFDFGQAALFLLDLHNKIGFFLGNQAYQAPEVIDLGEFGPIADVYSFGVVLHKMLTNQVPHNWKTVRDMRSSLVEINSKVANSAIFWLLAACIINSAQDRPTSAEVKSEFSLL